MTEEREEEVKEAGKNIKGMKGAQFLQTASELQQEVCPSVSGSTPLRDLSTGSVGIPNTPSAKPTPPPILWHAPECGGSESKPSSWSICRRVDRGVQVREKLQLELYITLPSRKQKRDFQQPLW